MCVFEWITLSIWGSVSGSPEDAHGMAVTMDTNVAAATTRFRLEQQVAGHQTQQSPTQTTCSSELNRLIQGLDGQYS